MLLLMFACKRVLADGANCLSHYTFIRHDGGFFNDDTFTITSNFHTYCTWIGINSTEHSTFYFESNPTTTAIETENCYIFSVPYGLFAKFTNLRTLNFQSSDISSIQISDFRGAHWLNKVNMSRNNIQKLRKHAFSLASSLQTIDLSWNIITEIATDTFENNNALQYVRLNNNRIKLFDCMLGSNIQTLELQKNQLHMFRPSSTSNGCKILLSNNNLTSLDGAMINHASVLDISNNPLKWSEIITNATIQRMTNTLSTLCYIGELLVMLDASNSQIANVIASNTSVLRELHLANNKLTAIGNLTSLSSLYYLDISFNTITDINVETFSNMTQLKTLKLKSSGIFTLDYGIFAHQINLAELDISYNHLKHINMKVLSFLFNLKTLNVDGNDLTSLDMNDLQHILPKLERIGISDNKFNCSYLISVVVLLTNFKMQVQIDDDLKVKNRSNVLGMHCSSFEQIEVTVTHSTNVNDMNELKNGGVTSELNEAFFNGTQNISDQSNLLICCFSLSMCLLLVLIYNLVYSKRKYERVARESNVAFDRDESSYII